MKLFASILLISTVPLWAQNVSPTIAPLPTREFGQLRLPAITSGLTSAAPNLVEGREFNQPASLAFDTSTSPAILYVADLTNNRVLGWKNPASLTAGNKADIVIGQNDVTSTLPQGPGGISTGLNTPTAVAVDKSGNLYVIDAGNNRILRYPKPAQAAQIQPDLVIGQKTFSGGNLANQGAQKPSDITVYFAANGVALLSGLAFDSNGNLWVTDSGNNRVIRYPAAKLQASTVPVNLQADLVVGQNTFTTNDAPQPFSQNNLGAFYQPNGLTFDSQNRLYVSDSLGRVLYFANPNVSGTFADRILGISPPPSPGQTLVYPTSYTLGAFNASGGLVGSPRGLFTSGTTLFVCDTNQNRVVRYDPPETWPAATATIPSPQIAAVYGQNDFVTGLPNRGLKVPATSGFQEPTAGAFLNGEMWIVDNKNNRVLSFPSTGTFNFVNASRVVGQDLYDSGAPDLIDSKGLFVNSSSFHAGSMVVDKTSTPNHLYVADPNNHRILAFKDVRTVGVDLRTVLTTGADLVIGQPDMLHSTINWPNGDIDLPTATGLAYPSGVTLDASGNLWVADAANGRVLRFPSPFNQPAGTQQTANLVLGQSSFTSKIIDPTAFNMRLPIGVAQFFNGALAVSDGALNRILIFRKSGSDFTNGQGAAVVLGQQNFNAGGTGTSAASLSSPRGLAVDTGDRLYVADTGNNRILIYANTGTISNGATASSTQISSGLNGPESVTVSTGTGINGDKGTGEIWVADTNNTRILRFPEFSTLVNSTNSIPTIPLNVQPIGIALDASDNLIVVDAANRLTFYYAYLYYQHAASYAFGLSSLGSRIAPGEFTIVKRWGKDFQFASNSALDALQSIPYPKTVADIQVLVDGVPAPVYCVCNGVSSVYFLVPNNTQSSGYSEIIVKTVSTNQILGVDYVQMVAAAPGFFTTNQQGTQQVSALNHLADGSYAPPTSIYNGSLNTATNSAPVARGAIIELYLTGMGHVDNGPADGVAPVNLYRSSQLPTISIGGQIVSSSDISYSGLSTQFPGLWQINVTVPSTTVPGDHVAITVQLQDQASNIGGSPVTLQSPIGTDRQLQVGPNTTPANPSLNGLIATIAVK